ncbi:insulinase family protein [Candidatus Woesearchaeota archaeon]|nr:insulinase family protein [Candidatus Woesearchaeota archaeon]
MRIISDQLSLLDLSGNLERRIEHGVLLGQRVSRASNGMTVITEDVPPEYQRQQPIISLYVFNVGYLNHPFGVPHGIAHMLLERSTDTRTGEDILQSAEERGIIFNDQLERGYAKYFVDNPTNHQLFELLSELLDQISNARIDPKEVELEKGNMRDEARRWESDSEVVSSLMARGMLFGLYPNYFRLWEQGTIDDLEAFSGQDVKNAKSAYYHSSNMTLFVSGSVHYDISTINRADRFHHDILDISERFFTESHHANGFRFKPFYPKASITKSVPLQHFDRDIPDIFLSKAYSVPEPNEKNYAAAEVLARILTIRTYIRLRMQEGFSYSPQFKLLEAPEYAFVFRTSFGPQHARESIDELHSIEKDIIAQGVDQRELEIARSGLINTARRLYRDGTSLIRQHKDERLGRIFFDRRISLFEGLVLEDINKVAKMVLTSPSAEVALGPRY